MKRFREQIVGAFEIPNQGLCLSLNHIDGLPQVDMHNRVGNRLCKIIALGRNSTDGQAVSMRDCLTGRPTPAYGSIVVEWIGSEPTTGEIYKLWVSEEARN